MIIINEKGTIGKVLEEYKYIDKRGLGLFVLPFTRWLRAKNALSYMTKGFRHLDIGCGDGYLIKKSPYVERIGIDKRVGDEVTEVLPFNIESFDCVTMLAVLEHVSNPNALFNEVHRVLMPGGLFIFTTPKKKAEFLINFYAKNIEDEHLEYFDLKRVQELANGLFNVDHYRTFIFGLNQVFCLRKK